ncbi:uncharacterized protein N7511_007689 [Penicillium nucicola]|uniref:uncharacterized protein n=1 Tax=Penicillium nucicola TaxID=1850975 RepID=UPI0025453B5A|nr:uncharacterized protein N7511_007689 [Penicillium nucicola]KAJ5753536.1 hypothetical protein N7511_007689 [Penicillium nucicola]
MLMKNIFAALALTGLVAAIPVDDFEERDLEERDQCKYGNNWCCESAVPLNLLFIQGSGKKCELKSGNRCPNNRPASLCCPQNQIVGKEGVVCVKY